MRCIALQIQSLTAAENGGNIAPLANGRRSFAPNFKKGDPLLISELSESKNTRILGENTRKIAKNGGFSRKRQAFHSSTSKAFLHRPLWRCVRA